MLISFGVYLSTHDGRRMIGIDAYLRVTQHFDGNTIKCITGWNLIAMAGLDQRLALGPPFISNIRPAGISW